MRKIILTCLVVFVALSGFTQDTAVAVKKGPSVTLPRSSDHFVFQLGYTMWPNTPDSIKTDGLSRSFNAYFMLDYPFKTNPHWSAAIGAGVATDNVFFDKTFVDIKGNTQTLRFRNDADTNHFKKFKIATAYLEAPVELRFRSNPNNDRKSVKFAVGAKVGLLVNAHTKGKNLESRTGSTLNSYTLKENSKRYFNRNRISATARFGYGHFSIFGSYQLTPLFKEGVAPTIRPFTVGLTLSGL